MLAGRPALMWRKDYDARLIRHNTQKYISLCPRALVPVIDRSSTAALSHMRALDYQTAFHLAPVGLVLSRERIIEDCNEQLCSIFGFEREALIGKSFQVLYPSPDEFARIGERIAAHISAQGTYSDDRIMKRRDGELFWCHVTGRALDSAAPHAAGVWTFEDLSATRRVAIELTPREREIAAQLVTGKTSKQIGRVLDISPRTVDIYRSRLMRKYDTGNATELLQRLLGT
jgi:PAS domain S-box-containing protein